MIHHDYHLTPGVIVAYLPADAKEDSYRKVQERARHALNSFSKWDEANNLFPFPMKGVRVEQTSDPALAWRLVARRLNVGCLASAYLITAPIWLAEEFMRHYFDLASTDCGDLHISTSAAPESYRMEAEPDRTYDALAFSVVDPDVVPETSEGQAQSEPAQERIKAAPEKSQRVKILRCIRHTDSREDAAPSRARWAVQEAIDQENWEEEGHIGQLEREKREFCNRIAALIADFVSRYNEMPPMDEVQELLRGKILLGNDGLSELVVNRDLQIILPAYNEVELPMYPLTKTLYLFFLRHPEGVRLVDLCDHRAELESLYTLVMPNRDDALATASIQALCDPLNTESLRQQISKIKRIVKAKILNDETARHYYISGRRGEAYSIPLSRNLVRLPLGVA